MKHITVRRLITMTLVSAMLISGCGETTEVVQNQVQIKSEPLKTILSEGEILYEKEEMLPGILVDTYGYQTGSNKLAVFEGTLLPGNFEIIDKNTDKVVYTGNVEIMSEEGEEELWGHGDFSDFDIPGEYYIRAELLGKSRDFSVSDTYYENLLEQTIEGLKSLKCDNTVSEYVHPENDTSVSVEISGGWITGEERERDVAEGCLAIFDLTKAYEYYPKAFDDSDENKIPDILDEVVFELEWLMKMQNPETGGVYTSVSVDADNNHFLVGETTRATAYFCAAMARCSYVFGKMDKNLSTEAMKCALLAWNCLEANAELVTPGQRFRAAVEMYRATRMSVYSDAIDEYLSVNADRDLSERIEADGAMSYMSTSGKVSLEYCTTLMQHFMSGVEHVAASAKYSRYLIREDVSDTEEILRDISRLVEADYIITSKEYGIIEENYLHYLCGRNPESKTDSELKYKPDAYAEFVFLLAKLKDK